MALVNNPDGRNVMVHYGPRKIADKKFGGEYGSKDLVKTASWVFNYDDAPAAAVSELEMKLPAYAKVTRCYTEILEDVTLGGDRTGITVQNVLGDYDSSADAAPALVRGALIEHDGALADVGSSAAELVSTLAATGGTTGSLTAGVFKVSVEYILEGPAY